MSNMQPLSFGHRLRQLREAAGLTLEQLAERAGLTAKGIGALERGERHHPYPHTVQALVTALHLSDTDRASLLAALPKRNPAPALPPAKPVKTPALLATKLYPPRQTQQVVTRPRLVERLNAGLAGSLTLVSAPAGFGKTTLVTSWLAHIELPYAWLALDALDDTPGTFLRYVVAALQGIDPAIGKAIVPQLQLSDAVPPQTIIGLLLNELADLSYDIALVLDDLHVLTHPAIYAALAYLLDHLPPHVHLVLLTREDPPVPLARLRVRRQLVEVRAADLRFTAGEAEAFITEAMHLALPSTDVAALVRRTEGWIAGLQLAALSLRDLHEEDMTTAVDSFTGTHRFVVDYLVDEVVAMQPPYMQHFLLHTSILDRLCGSLCDALLLNEAPASSSTSDAPNVASGQAILEAVERANLFLLPLDNARRWYRYHHLFAEVVRARLVSSAPPEQIRQLHQRASAWCEQAGLLAEAVQYALRAQDWDRGARLIEEQGAPYALDGHIETVLGWLNTLPAGTVRARPALCLLHAGLLLSTHHLERAAALLDWVEQIVPAGEANAHVRGMLAQHAALRSTLTRFAGDLPQSVALGQQALQYTEVHRSTAAIRLSVAHAFLVSGDVGEQAEQQLATLLTQLGGTQQPAIALRRDLLWAWLRVLQGRLHDAERAYRTAPQLLAGGERSLPLIVGGAAYYFGLGDLLCEWNDLDGAAHLLEQGMSLARGALAIEPDILLHGVVTLARLHLARRDYSTARETLHEFTHLTHSRPLAAYLPTRIAAMEAYCALLDGDLDRAVHWADRYHVDPLDNLSYLHEGAYLTLARIRIAQGRANPKGSQVEATLDLLDRLLMAAEKGARHRSALEMLVLRALAQDAHGNANAACATLARAVRMAVPEGYVRVFVDEGAPMAALLARLQDAGGTPHPYINTLLAACGVMTHTEAAVRMEDVDLISRPPQ